MNNEIRRHQIEELLLNAHLESEGGIDLIEEYFATSSSLDRVTEHAHMILQESPDPEIHKAVLKNLAECIVVKNQRDQDSLWGVFRQGLSKLGVPHGKSNEIVRAESLLRSYRLPPI